MCCGPPVSCLRHGSSCSSWVTPVAHRSDLLAGAELLPALRDIDHALELGAGLGLVSLALTRSGRLARVVATDGDPGCCANIELSKRLNGLAHVLSVERLEWGDHMEADEQVARAIRQCSGEAHLPHQTCGREQESKLDEDLTLISGRRGQRTGTMPHRPRANLLLMADVIYETSLFTTGKGPGTVGSGALENTVRRLIARGDFTHVVLAWVNRMGGESALLTARIADLGATRTVWTGKVADGKDAGISVLDITSVIGPTEPQAQRLPVTPLRSS